MFRRVDNAIRWMAQLVFQKLPPDEGLVLRKEKAATLFILL